MPITANHIVIVGQGLVGASLALLMAEAGMAVTQIEAQAPAPNNSHEFADRYLALNAFSLECLGRLRALPPMGLCGAIKNIHISRVGEFGHVQLAAERVGLAQLGAVVPAKQLALAFEQAIAQQTLIHRVRGKVVHLEVSQGQAQLQLDDGTSVNAALVLAADGTNSSIRNLSNIAVYTFGATDETALVFNARFEKPHQQCAYERFTDTGPIALLPLPEQRMGVVWTMTDSQANALLALPASTVQQRLQSAFGFRLGRLQTISNPSVWPLRRLSAQQTVADSVVLLGNAAQTLHPIGAQGFNLGLRDAVALVHWLQTNHRYDLASLKTYAELRAPDRQKTIAWSEQLLHGTRSQHPLAKLLRVPTLAWLAYAPLAQLDFIRFGLGFTRAAQLMPLPPAAT